MITYIAVILVAVLHIGFLILEMFLWKKPSGRRIFGLNHELASQTATLAANQGLYNGFLAAGLVWGLLSSENPAAIFTFFLTCIITAGIFGAFTVKRSILFIQALPAAIALILVWTSGI